MSRSSLKAGDPSEAILSSMLQRLFQSVPVLRHVLGKSFRDPPQSHAERTQKNSEGWRERLHRRVSESMIYFSRKRSYNS